MVSPAQNGALDDFVAIGLILKPFGLGGGVHVKAYGGALRSLALPAPVVLKKLKRASGAQARLRDCRPTPKGCNCFFDRYEDREAAEQLRNCEVLIAYALLPRLETDAYYHFELESAEVFDTQGCSLGRVAGLHNFPAGDALEVKLHDTRSVLVPMQKETVTCIDIPSKKITIDRTMLDELL
ncbi:MAG: 16S rRNA processing protein RimM [Chitinivibrionales bacterium]|nr:16S rRNA processing protein RimM [Chitinivibrionales bacterium]